MGKTMTRTFTISNIVIKDSVSGEELEKSTTYDKVTKAKVAIGYIKKTGKTNFIVDVTEVEETREMEVDFFLKNSKIVEKKPETTEQAKTETK